YSAATIHYNESLAIARAMEDAACIAIVLGHLGSLAQALGDYAQSAELLAESLALRQELGKKAESVTWEIFGLGKLAWHQGDNTRALAHFAKCLAWFRETGDTVAIAACLERIALVAIVAAQPMPGVRLFGAAGAIRDAFDHPPYPDEQHEYDRLIATAREQLGEDAFAAACATGRPLPLGNAVAH